MTFDYAFFYSITALSSLFWIFAAIRQYKSELFWYFFILAITDPIILAQHLTGTLVVYTGYVSWAFILFLVVYWPYKRRSYIKIIIALFFLLWIVTPIVFSKPHYGSMTLFHAMIIFLFLKRSLKYIADNGKVNLFHLTLILYEASIILKTLSIMTDVHTGVTFYYITDIFQILIAVFFSIFREDDKRLLINLKNV